MCCFKLTPRWYWDILVVVLLMFTVIVLPVSIAFYSEDQTEPQWLTLNTLVDFLFMTDIVINFRTGIASTQNPDIVSQIKISLIYYVQVYQPIRISEQKHKKNFYLSKLSNIFFLKTNVCVCFFKDQWARPLLIGACNNMDYSGDLGTSDSCQAISSWMVCR